MRKGTKVQDTVSAEGNVPYLMQTTSDSHSSRFMAGIHDNTSPSPRSPRYPGTVEYSRLERVPTHAYRKDANEAAVHALLQQVYL